MREIRISQNSWIALLISAIIIIGIGIVGAYVPIHSSSNVAMDVGTDAAADVDADVDAVAEDATLDNTR